MKKFMKFCGIVVLVLVLLGVIMWGVGEATAGSENMSSLVDRLSNGWIQIDVPELQSSIAETLDNNALYDIDDSDMFEKEHDIWKDEVDKVLVADGKISKLDIELGGCLFELKASGGTSYYVEYNGKGKTQVYVEEDELYVKVLNGKEWNINTDNGSVTLYIPADVVFEEVEIELGAGQMKLDNLKTLEIEIDLGAGQVLSKNLQAEEAALSVGAGEIVLEDVQMKDVQAEVGAGNCEIEGNVTGNIEVDCAMGNVTFELAGSEQDFNYDIQAVTGNISIGKNEYSGLSKEQLINNNAARNIKLDCAMGNIEVKFK